MAVQLAQRLSCAALRANMTMQFYGNMFTVGQTGVSAVIDLSSVLPISASDPKLQPSGRLRGRTRLTTTNDDDEIKVKSVAISNYKYFQGIGKSDPKVVGRRKSLTIPEIDVACGPPDFNVTCRRKHAEDYIYKMAKKEFKGMSTYTIFFIILFVCIRLLTSLERLK